MTLALLMILAPPAPNAGYVRIEEPRKGVVTLSTAARRFVRPGAPDVWLVGAIHVGRKAYYDELQSILDGQSVVLYEGVRSDAKPVAAPKPAAKGAAPSVYKVLSDAIGLEFQMERLRYDRTGWENADLTWEEMAALEKASGKPTQLGAVKGLLTPGSAGSEALGDMLRTATPGTREAFKLLIIRNAGGEALKTVLGGGTEKIILDARNLAALSALRRKLGESKPPRSVAIFYGAAHLPGLARTLEGELGYVGEPPHWLLAAEADEAKLDANGRTLLDAFQQAMPPPKKPKG